MPKVAAFSALLTVLTALAKIATKTRAVLNKSYTRELLALHKDEIKEFFSEKKEVEARLNLSETSEYITQMVLPCIRERLHYIRQEELELDKSKKPKPKPPSLVPLEKLLVSDSVMVAELLLKVVSAEMLPLVADTAGKADARSIYYCLMSQEFDLDSKHLPMLSEKDPNRRDILKICRLFRPHLFEGEQYETLIANSLLSYPQIVSYLNGLCNGKEIKQYPATQFFEPGFDTEEFDTEAYFASCVVPAVPTEPPAAAEAVPFEPPAVLDVAAILAQLTLPAEPPAPTEPSEPLTEPPAQTAVEHPAHVDCASNDSDHE
jgi:hypothetical protein